MSEVIKFLRAAVEHRERVSLDDIDVAALLAEFDRLRADAARYQFIRAGNVYIEAHESGEIYMATFTGKYYTDKNELDAAIDAAIKASECGDDDDRPR